MVRASRGGGAAIAFVLPPFCLERIPEDGIRLRGELRVGREPLVRRLQQFLAVLGEVSESHHVPLLAHELADPDRARAEVFSDIAHPTALGNRIMAKDLADGITALEILETDRRPR
jgi:lysophospholipase L1-like esterase